MIHDIWLVSTAKLVIIGQEVQEVKLYDLQTLKQYGDPISLVHFLTKLKALKVATLR